MKTYKCKMCNYSVSTDEKGSKAYQRIRRKLGEHYDTKHKEDLPAGMDGYRYLYFLLTGKDKGKCIICGRPTEFNRVTMKYARFCDNPECKQIYRKERDRRVMAKYGKLYVTDDPEFQKKMLANRRISGIYKWHDGTAEFQYVGTYEKDFLEYLDNVLKWPSGDIMIPSPNTYYYDYNGKQHFYCPDVYLVPYKLEVEIKSSVRMDKQNPESREKEILKDELMKSLPNVNYIRIMDKDYGPFNKYINDPANKVVEVKTESFITEENNSATTFKLFDMKFINAVKEKSKKLLVGFEKFKNNVFKFFNNNKKKIAKITSYLEYKDYNESDITKLREIFSKANEIDPTLVPLSNPNGKNVLSKSLPEDITLGINTAFSNKILIKSTPINKVIGLLSYDQIINPINDMFNSQDYIYNDLLNKYKESYKENKENGILLDVNPASSEPIIERLCKLPDNIINNHQLAYPLNKQGFKMDKDEYLQYIQDNIKTQGNSDHASYNQEILDIVDMVTGEHLKEVRCISPMIVQNALSLGITKVIQTKELNPVTLNIIKGYMKVSNIGVSDIKVGDVDQIPKFKSTVNYNNVENIKTQLDNRFMKQALSEFIPNSGDKRINNIDVTRSSIDYNSADKLAAGLPMKQANLVFINPNKKQAIDELNKRLSNIQKELTDKGVSITNPNENELNKYGNEIKMMRSLQRDLKSLYTNQKYDKSIMDKYRNYDLDNTFTEAKELKYDYRIEYDTDTGHQLLIQYSLDNIIVTDTGASFFYLGRENRDGINQQTGKYDNIEDMPKIIKLVRLVSISLINTYENYYKYRNYVVNELENYLKGNNE